MKKIIIIIIGVLLITYAIIVVYVNTKSYKYKIALKSRSAQIEEYNSYNRRFIYEGVYSFIHEVDKKQMIINEFGVRTENITTEQYIRGKASFSKNKLDILCNGIREEFIFDNIKIRQDWDTTNSIYYFHIASWKAYQVETDKCIFVFNDSSFINAQTVDIDGIWNCMTLDVEYGEKPHLSIWPNSFKSLVKSASSIDNGMIYLDEILQNYNNTFLPTYPQCKYLDSVYDIEYYIDDGVDFIFFKL